MILNFFFLRQSDISASSTFSQKFNYSIEYKQIVSPLTSQWILSISHCMFTILTLSTAFVLALSFNLLKSKAIT